MSRTAIIAMVCLTAYTAINLVVSALVAVTWRTRTVAPFTLPPVARARRIFLLRITPVVAAASITLLIVAPAFALFEPMHENEKFGPVGALAAIGLIQLLAGAFIAVAGIGMTRRIERGWLRTSTALSAPPGMRAFVVDDTPPILALVGVFSPKLIAARSIIDSCNDQEIAMIVAHERGHLTARDNLKRWVMLSLPDILRPRHIHHEMLEAWHQAAEDAADDAATGGDPCARADLAALLLKVVRAVPRPVPRAAVVSPFVEVSGLERRVRRLMQPELEPPAPIALVPVIGLSLIVALGVATLSSPSMLRAIFEAFESLVAFGR